MGIEATFMFLSARKLVPYPINSPILRFYTHDFAFPSNNSLKRINFTFLYSKIDKYFRAGPQAILNDSY
jgi:hypothetical protein